MFALYNELQCTPVCDLVLKLCHFLLGESRFGHFEKISVKVRDEVYFFIQNMMFWYLLFSQNIRNGRCSGTIF